MSDAPWAIVLGGSSGIGLACAQRLARDGFNLCIVYRETRSGARVAQQAFDDMLSAGHSVCAFNVDAIKSEGQQHVLNGLGAEALGRVAVLVHAIAHGSVKPIAVGAPLPTYSKQWPQPEPDSPRSQESAHAYTLLQQAYTQLSAASAPGTSRLNNEDVQLTIEAMGTSLFSWVQVLFAGGWFAADTRVLALTSEGARRAFPGYAAVSAAKAALEAIVRSLAVELGPHGVRVNAVQAGVTDTASLRRIPHSEFLKLSAVQRNPLGRLTQPVDVANVVSLLCRQEASWINGTIVTVDGGESLC